MEILAQGNTVTTVCRENDTVVSETVFLNRLWEARGMIRADIRTYVIKDAGWEISENPAGLEPGERKIDFPSGTVGHIQGKKALGAFVRLPGGIMMKYLMNQCLNGLIQGETYIIHERGYETREEYNAFWNEIEKNGCRMYTYPDSSDLPWMEFVPKHSSDGKNLFNRFKSWDISCRGDEMTARGRFNDTYHELGLEIGYDRHSGTAGYCDVFYRRAPGASCFGNSIHGQKLAGRNLYEIRKPELIEIFGRYSGCYHLTEIARDTVNEIKSLHSGGEAAGE